ncbi:putative kinesin heavy chain isoform 5C [Ixodes scapularis]
MYRCTQAVLAYGQTGSGKTFTMGTSCASRTMAEDTGIIPRAVQDIFAAVGECRASKDFLEIYKEDILDLLRSQDPLATCEDNRRRQSEGVLAGGKSEYATRRMRGVSDGACYGALGAVLAYGQTGSGKTFTMGTSCASRAMAEDTGIIPRAVQDIFAAVGECRASKDFLEIYKEDILDLLRSQDPLATCEDNRRSEACLKLSRTANRSGVRTVGSHVGSDDSAVQRRVASAEEAFHQLEVGSASRSTGSTEMNTRSSRSHAIYTLAVELKEPGANDVTTSKFHLVDLAGSERASKTKAVGDRFREGVQNNLGNVISALCDESGHIPGFKADTSPPRYSGCFFLS